MSVKKTSSRKPAAAQAVNSEAAVDISLRAVQTTKRLKAYVTRTSRPQTTTVFTKTRPLAWVNGCKVGWGPYNHSTPPAR